MIRIVSVTVSFSIYITRSICQRTFLTAMFQSSKLVPLQPIVNAVHQGREVFLSTF